MGLFNLKVETPAAREKREREEAIAKREQEREEAIARGEEPPPSLEEELASAEAAVKSDKPWNLEPAEGEIVETGYNVPIFDEEEQYATTAVQTEGGSLSVCLLVSGNTFGNTDEELGRQLLQSFFASLSKQSIIPNHVLFIGSGVFLTAADSPVVSKLLDLYEEDSILLSCAESLEYYGLSDAVAVGRVTGMDEITMILHMSDKVITI